MKYFILIFYLITTQTFGAPGRFGGFTYNLDDKGRVKHDEKTVELTENFNKDFATGINEEPQKPFYLTENNKNTVEKDKYNLVPTYSLKQIHNSTHTEKGKIENNKSENNEDSDENNDTAEDNIDEE